MVSLWDHKPRWDDHRENASVEEVTCKTSFGMTFYWEIATALPLEQRRFTNSDIVFDDIHLGNEGYLKSDLD